MKRLVPARNVKKHIVMQDDDMAWFWWLRWNLEWNHGASVFKVVTWQRYHYMFFPFFTCKDRMRRTQPGFAEFFRAQVDWPGLTALTFFVATQTLLSQPSRFCKRQLGLQNVFCQHSDDTREPWKVTRLLSWWRTCLPSLYACLDLGLLCRAWWYCDDEDSFNQQLNDVIKERLKHLELIKVSSPLGTQ